MTRVHLLPLIAAFPVTHAFGMSVNPTMAPQPGQSTLREDGLVVALKSPQDTLIDHIDEFGRLDTPWELETLTFVERLFHAVRAVRYWSSVILEDPFSERAAKRHAWAKNTQSVLHHERTQALLDTIIENSPSDSSHALFMRQLQLAIWTTYIPTPGQITLDVSERLSEQFDVPPALWVPGSTSGDDEGIPVPVSTPPIVIDGPGVGGGESDHPLFIAEKARTELVIENMRDAARLELTRPIEFDGPSNLIRPGGGGGGSILDRYINPDAPGSGRNRDSNILFDTRRNDILRTRRLDPRILLPNERFRFDLDGYEIDELSPGRVP